MRNTIIGIMWGLVICLLIWLFTSCAKKVTTSSEREVSTSTTVQREDSTIVRMVDSTLTKSISSLESWWNANVKTTTYEYDSLGNRRVASETLVETNGGVSKMDTSSTSRGVDLNAKSASVEAVHDTLYVRTSETKATATGVPFIWKLGAYIGLALSALLVLYLLYKYLPYIRKFFI